MFEIAGTAKITETTEAVKTAGANKDGKKSENKYPENFAWVLYIRYPIIFWKKSVSVSVFFDLRSKVNAIYLIFAKELGLPIRSTNVGA